MEERVYDQVIEGLRGRRAGECSILVSDLESREKEDMEPVHVINLDVVDNHEDATIGAFIVCDLCAEVPVFAWAIPQNGVSAGEVRRYR